MTALWEVIQQQGLCCSVYSFQRVFYYAFTGETAS
jgi:hypothetical protein